jgi:hypothetical protein
MARNPDDRPATMEAFEYELTKCMAGRGAAVAQILGMSTDQHLVASMNPGLSGRTIDSGVFARPVPTSSPGLQVPSAAALARARRPRCRDRAEPAADAAPRRRRAEVAAVALDDVDSLAIPARRSGWATAAWTLLGMGSRSASA